MYPGRASQPNKFLQNPDRHKLKEHPEPSQQSFSFSPNKKKCGRNLVNLFGRLKSPPRNVLVNLLPSSMFVITITLHEKKRKVKTTLFPFCQRPTWLVAQIAWRHATKTSSLPLTRIRNLWSIIVPTLHRWRLSLRKLLLNQASQRWRVFLRQIGRQTSDGVTRVQILEEIRSWNN